jgi:hypothetical protein
MRGRLAHRLDKIAPDGPILDVGCGDGALLDSLRKMGRSVCGLEREVTGPDVRSSEIQDIEGGWAGIVMWHSLEHLREPGNALDAAVERLLPNGVLVVAVPNIASLQARAFGRYWLALDMPRHLTHIPASTLIRKIRALGLRVERTSGWRGGQGLFGWLDGCIARVTPGNPSLYDAIRRPEARSRPMSSPRRYCILALAAGLAPIATVLWAIELLAGRGGTTYVEARRV